MKVSYLWKPNMEAERMDWLEHGINDLTTKRAVCLPRRNFAPPSVTVAGNKLESSVLLRHFQYTFTLVPMIFNVHSFLGSIHHFRMSSPCLGFSLLLNSVLLFSMLFLVFWCQQPKCQSCFEWSPSHHLAPTTQVPSDEKCTWDRQKLKLQIERGTMSEAPSCFCVLLCEVMSTAATSHNSVSKIEDPRKSPQKSYTFCRKPFSKKFRGSLNSEI